MGRNHHSSFPRRGQSLPNPRVNRCTLPGRRADSVFPVHIVVHLISVSQQWVMAKVTRARPCRVNLRGLVELSRRHLAPGSLSIVNFSLHVEPTSSAVTARVYCVECSDARTQRRVVRIPRGGCRNSHQLGDARGPLRNTEGTIYGGCL